MSPRMVEAPLPLLCICVPARNEAARLPRLIAAIAAQDWPGIIPLVIAVNNSTDDSLEVLERCRARYHGRLELHVSDTVFAPDQAHAGSARRLAMDSGAALLERSDNDRSDINNAILVSTDADARPPRDWLTNIAAAIANGADLVGGQLEIDPDEPLPPAAARLRRALDRYWVQVRAIEDAIDPIAWDPPPRHGDHTGASLAITLRAYKASGGVPRVPLGEDLALVTAAQACGARLVHPHDVRIMVSPRRDGRASGGMAQDMALLVATGESGASLMMPDFAHWRARAQWRRALRQQPGGLLRMLQEEAALPVMPHDMALEIGA